MVQFRARAHNKNGWGAYSQANVGNAFVLSVPAKMPAPTEGNATSFDQVQVNWQSLSTLVETGGTFSITSYNLQMRSSSTAAWVSIIGGVTPYT